MDKYQLFAELISDEEKAKEILSESIEETRANLLKEGLDFSVEELTEMSQGVGVSTNNEELGEDALDDVAGGIAFSALCGVALGAYAISAYAGVVKKWLNRR